MKRFEDKGRSQREAPIGARSGPRARAAQDRKFGAARSRDSNRDDPYQRSTRPPRPDSDRGAPSGERLRAPVRQAGITLDPDVARVFRDSEAVNEALRLVIRLARTVGGGGRPAFNRSGPPGRSGPPSRSRSGAPPDRYRRDEPRAPSSPAPRESRFEDSE